MPLPTTNPRRRITELRAHLRGENCSLSPVAYMAVLVAIEGLTVQVLEAAAKPCASYKPRDGWTFGAVRS